MNWQEIVCAQGSKVARPLRHTQWSICATMGNAISFCIFATERQENSQFRDPFFEPTDCNIAANFIHFMSRQGQ